MKSNLLARVLLAGLVGTASFQVNGQIFIDDYATGTIGEYSLTGGLINSSLVSSLYQPRQLAIDNSGILYVGDGRGMVFAYDTSGTRFGNISLGIYPFGIATGADGIVYVGGNNGTIHRYSLSSIADTFISTEGLPNWLNVDGSGNIYVSDPATGFIGSYSSSGTVIDNQLISISRNSYVASGGFALDRNGHLFVPFPDGSISEYTTSGELLNPSLITGQFDLNGMTVGQDGYLYVIRSDGTVGQYSTSGETVNASLISGLSDPIGIVVIPEPSSAVLTIIGAGILLLRRRN